MVTRTLVKSGVSSSLRDISAQLYRDFAGPQKWEVYHDVHHTLNQLRSSGILLGVISNFDERLGKCDIMYHQFIV